MKVVTTLILAFLSIKTFGSETVLKYDQPIQISSAIREIYFYRSDGQGSFSYIFDAQSIGEFGLRGTLSDGLQLVHGGPYWRFFVVQPNLCVEAANQKFCVGDQVVAERMAGGKLCQINAFSQAIQSSTFVGKERQAMVVCGKGWSAFKEDLNQLKKVTSLNLNQ